MAKKRYEFAGLSSAMWFSRLVPRGLLPIAVCLWVPWCQPSLLAQEPNKVDALVGMFKSSESDDERVRSASEIVRYDIEFTDNSLLAHEDDSVALLCFWHRRYRRWLSQPAGNIALRKNDVKEFADFIKVRLDVSAPPEWLNAIASGQVTEDKNIRFDAAAYFEKCSLFQTESSPHIESAEKDGNGRLALQVVCKGQFCGENRLVVCPDSLSEEALEYIGELYGTRTLTAICSPKSNIISFAKHDPIEWRFEVHSFTNEPSKARDFTWKTRSVAPWKLSRSPMITGTLPGAAELRLNDTSVFIFSLFRWSFCIEELDLKSGELRMCFSHLLAGNWLR